MANDEKALAARGPSTEIPAGPRTASKGGGVRATLTIDDIDQIVEGIAQFIISGDPDVEEVWQPYLNKLATLRADLLVIETALDVLDASICECGHLDANHQFTDPAHNDIVDDCSGDNPPGFGNCGCREFRPVVFLVTRVPPAAADAVRGSTDEPLVPIRETTS